MGIITVIVRQRKKGGEGKENQYAILDIVK